MDDLEPTIRSRELGRALQRAAKAKGLSGSHIARQLGWSNSRVSRLYSGKRGSGNHDDIVAVLALCGIIGPERDELLELSRTAYQENWWQQYGDRLPPELCALRNYEDVAVASTDFETTVVPGLLQTPAYMRALMRRTPSIPPDEIGIRITARRQRQRMLERSDPGRFVFFMDEYALFRTGPGEKIMSEQVHHLLRMAVRPHIQIRIVPDAVGFHAGHEPFMIMRFNEIRPITFIENQTSSLFLERRDTIDGYRRTVEHLSAVALDERRSREVLASLAKELSGPGDDSDAPGSPPEEEFPQRPHQRGGDGLELEDEFLHGLG